MDIQKVIDFLHLDKHRIFFRELQKIEEFSINQIRDLTNKYPDYPVKDLLSQIRLQRKNLSKNPQAYDLIFNEKGAQQASSFQLSQYHAQKFADFQIIADLCCGIGADLRELAKCKTKIFALDVDLLTLRIAEYNNREQSNIEFIQDNAENFDEYVEAVFIDPDRRPSTERVLDFEDMSPSLRAILKIHERYRNIAVKLSPASNYKSLKLPFEHTFEFISENGNLKEILLCMGELATPNVNRRAVILPQKVEVFKSNVSVSVKKIQKYIFEPDAAIIRAGLVQEIGKKIGYDLIDKNLALLSSVEPISESFGTTYKVSRYFPFDLKELRRYCRENEIGELVIKTRGFPESVESFRKKLKLRGKNRIILFILRYHDSHLMLLADRLVE